MIGNKVTIGNSLNLTDRRIGFKHGDIIFIFIYLNILCLVLYPHVSSEAGYRMLLIHLSEMKNVIPI